MKLITPLTDQLQSREFENYYNSIHIYQKEHIIGLVKRIWKILCFKTESARFFGSPLGTGDILPINYPCNTA